MNIKIKIGIYQFRSLFGQKRKNLSKIITGLNSVDADIIVLPELPFTGYNFRDRDEVKYLAEDPYQSEIVTTLKALCKEKNFYIVTGFAEKAQDKYFNSSLLIGPEGIIHIYRKIHLFNNEKYWFDPGDTPLQVNTVREAKIGMMVCWDWVFPEVARVLALQGADIICHPSNLVLDYCQRTMIGRSLENSLFTVTANRFGMDNRPHGSIKFTGKSQIVDPRGNVIFKARSNRVCLFVAEVDLSLAKDKRLMPLNDLFEDRRPEFYKTLL